MAAWHEYTALHQLSQHWSFCLTAPSTGFPFLLVSPGFEKLTMHLGASLVGKKCGDVLKAPQLNPEEILIENRRACEKVALGQQCWADFLCHNQRADGTKFVNYVRVASLNLLTKTTAKETEGVLIGLQHDASKEAAALVPENYESLLQAVRTAVPWPCLHSQAGRELALLAKRSLQDQALAASSDLRLASGSPTNAVKHLRQRAETDPGQQKKHNRRHESRCDTDPELDKRSVHSDRTMSVVRPPHPPPAVSRPKKEDMLQVPADMLDDTGSQSSKTTKASTKKCGFEDLWDWLPASAPVGVVRPPLEDVKLPAATREYTPERRFFLDTAGLTVLGGPRPASPCQAPLLEEVSLPSPLDCDPAPAPSWCRGWRLPAELPDLSPCSSPEPFGDQVLADYFRPEPVGPGEIALRRD
jgi:hypothetical protein